MDGKQHPQSNVCFKNILLATDGSEFSSGAEALTIAIVLRFGGRVTAMQMALSQMALVAMEVEQMVAVTEQWRSHARTAMRSLDEVKERMDQQGVPCTPLVKYGYHPHEEIINAAVEINADLIVMGRRGRRGLARLMLGDTTARVVAQSPRNVLVVPKSGGTLWTTSILLATDGSSYSDRAGEEAILLAKEADVPLRVISVVEDKSRTDSFRIADVAVERIVSQAKAAGVMVEGTVLEGHPPADAIAEEVKNANAGLVVGGSHGRTGLERVFIGSVMERLLGKVSCPVLVVKGG